MFLRVFEAEKAERVGERPQAQIDKYMVVVVCILGFEELMSDRGTLLAYLCKRHTFARREVVELRLLHDASKEYTRPVLLFKTCT